MDSSKTMNSRDNVPSPIRVHKLHTMSASFADEVNNEIRSPTGRIFDTLYGRVDRALIVVRSPNIVSII